MYSNEDASYIAAEEYAKGHAAGAAAVEEALAWPSCWNCRFAVMFEDRSVGIQLHIDDCRRNFGGVDEEDIPDEDLEEEMAYKCGCWQPNVRAIGNIW